MRWRTSPIVVGTGETGTSRGVFKERILIDALKGIDFPRFWIQKWCTTYLGSPTFSAMAKTPMCSWPRRHHAWVSSCLEGLHLGVWWFETGDRQGRSGVLVCVWESVWYIRTVCPSEKANRLPIEGACATESPRSLILDLAHNSYVVGHRCLAGPCSWKCWKARWATSIVPGCCCCGVISGRRSTTPRCFGSPDELSTPPCGHL